MSEPGVRERFVEAMLAWEPIDPGYVRAKRKACEAFALKDHKIRLHSVSTICGATCEANDPEVASLLKEVFGE